ncbi:MAG: hypothetical protein Q7R47_00180 [Candidatus Diapherotrites archaeon]|nr:hypothetical protein [Candidatus Diapherotrites archaeon]
MGKSHTLTELKAEIRQLRSRTSVAEQHLKRWFLGRIRRLKKQVAVLQRKKNKKTSAKAVD